MAKAVRSEETGPETGAVTESITYTPGEGDPSTVTWCGHVFRANVPKDIAGHADGSEREKLNFGLIESAKLNKHFLVGNARPKREVNATPKTADEYRAYFVAWLKDPSMDHADKLIARFARDRDLQLTCEVGADDFAYLSTLFMPRLHELAKADELTEAQVASLWINAGVNQLPW